MIWCAKVMQVCWCNVMLIVLFPSQFMHTCTPMCMYMCLYSDKYVNMSVKVQCMQICVPIIMIWQCHVNTCIDVLLEQGHVGAKQLVIVEILVVTHPFRGLAFVDSLLWIAPWDGLHAIPFVNCLRAILLHVLAWTIKQLRLIEFVSVQSNELFDNIK